jgi:hypothetical protein
LSDRHFAQLRSIINHCQSQKKVMRPLIFAVGLIFPSFFTSHIYGFHVNSFRQMIRPSRILETGRSPQTSKPIDQRFASEQDNEELQGEATHTLRDKLRQATGFSSTAFRSAWRTATGVSLSALYATTALIAGLWIRTISATVLGIFPAWFRYFIQPFLVLYYAPIFILRGLSGPTRKNARAKHELVIDGWKEAIGFAEKAGMDGYEPVQWNGE